MAVAFTPEFIQAFNDPASIKVLSTTDGQGHPHVVFKGSLRVDDHGRITLYELTEYSETNRNLVRAIWFGGRVAVNVKTPDNRSFHLTARPERAVIAGPLFEAVYQGLRERLGDVDLSTIWILEAESLHEKGKPARERADEGRIPLIHLDRIARA